MSDEYLRQVQAELKQLRSANTTNLKRIAELETQHTTLLANVGELVAFVEDKAYISHVPDEDELDSILAKLKQEDV